MTLTLVLKKGFYPKEYIRIVIYVKYERSITYHSKAMVYVEILVKKQTDVLRRGAYGVKLLFIQCNPAS